MKLFDLFRQWKCRRVWNIHKWGEWSDPEQYENTKTKWVMNFGNAFVCEGYVTGILQSRKCSLCNSIQGRKIMESLVIEKIEVFTSDTYIGG